MPLSHVENLKMITICPMGHLEKVYIYTVLRFSLTKICIMKFINPIILIMT